MLFILVGMIMLLCGIVQTTTGLPGGTFAVIFLSEPVGSIVETGALNTICSMCCTITLFLHYRKSILYQEAIFPAVGYLLVMPICSKLAIHALSTYLRPMLGLLLMGLSIYFWFYEGRIVIKPSRTNGMLAGITSGILSGLFSIGSVPMVIYYLNALKDKDQYMGTLQFFLIFTCTYSTIVRAMLGVITIRTLALSLPGIMGIVLGTCLGGKLVTRLPVAMIRKMTLAVIGVSGICLFIPVFI